MTVVDRKLCLLNQYFRINYVSFDGKLGIWNDLISLKYTCKCHGLVLPFDRSREHCNLNYTKVSFLNQSTLEAINAKHCCSDRMSFYLHNEEKRNPWTIIALCIIANDKNKFKQMTIFSYMILQILYTISKKKCILVLSVAEIEMAFVCLCVSKKNSVTSAQSNWHVSSREALVTLLLMEGGVVNNQ